MDKKAYPTDIDKDVYKHDTGMDLRDYFAAKAMQSHIQLLRHQPFVEEVHEISLEENKDMGEIMATMSYEIADLMLKERLK